MRVPLELGVAWADRDGAMAGLSGDAPVDFAGGFDTPLRSFGFTSGDGSPAGAGHGERRLAPGFAFGPQAPPVPPVGILCPQQDTGVPALLKHCCGL